MAKKSTVARNKKRTRLVELRQEKRSKLRDTSSNGDFDEQAKAQKSMQQSRNESYIRIRARCNSCGRPRATLKKFGICRICLREAVMRGDVPGLRKASW